MKNNYRVPKDANFLIILPELDVKGERSPSIKKWLDQLDKNSIIPRNFIHIAFFSNFYGIIPLELSSSFPMGQHESLELSSENDIIYQNLVHKTELFFNLYAHYYSKCGILVPEKFINQFNETVEFFKKDLLISLTEMLDLKFKLRIATFRDITSLIRFFKNDAK